MFIGLYWFFQGTSGEGSFPAGILIFLSYTIILRKEDSRRYADLIKSKEIPLTPQTILLRKLEKIPTFWLVYASKPAGESADHTIYFELYERGNFLIRCGKGIITINFIRSGIAGEYDIPVEFAVDDYLAHEIKTREKYQYHTEEEVVDLLKTHGYIIEKLLIENRFYKINNRWNDLP